MFKKYVKLGLFLGLALAFSAHAGYLPPLESPFPPAENPFYLDTFNEKQLSYFTNLVVSDKIDVNVNVGSQRSAMILTGDKETIKRVQFKQADETLTIWLSPEFFDGDSGPAKVHIDIYTHFLNDITLKDYTGHFQATNLNTPYLNANLDNSGSVSLSGKIGLNNLIVSGNGITQIHGINSQSVSIQMTENPTIDLTGIVNLESLKANGTGHLRLYWVDSDALTVSQSGKTYVELAGIANRVYLKLNDQAHFNGRYLRAKLGYAKTYDNSVADVQFLNSQSVLANDNSTISFFGKPPYHVDFMAKNGAVLDMTDH